MRFFNMIFEPFFFQTSYSILQVIRFDVVICFLFLHGYELERERGEEEEEEESKDKTREEEKEERKEERSEVE